jgi:3',5'-cyclic-AMP phosphodiesterase
MTLKIGIVSDIHLGRDTRFRGVLRKVGHRAQELTEAFVVAMNEEFRPDAVFNLGDVVQDMDRGQDLEHYGRIWRALGELTAPLIPVNGNHDVIAMSEEDVLAFWQRPSLHYETQIGGLRVLVLNTHEAKDSHVWLPQEQVEWLRGRLELPGKAIVLMHHSAADQDTQRNYWFTDHPHLAVLRNRGAVRDVISAAGNVLAVINGHLHWNQLTMHDGIPYITVHSLTENPSGEEDPARPVGGFGELVFGDGFARLDIRGLERASYRWETGWTPLT